MKSQEEIHALYRVAMEKEEAFSAALEERFGAEAGDRRYQPLPAEMLDLQMAARASAEAYRIACAETRGERPIVTVCAWCPESEIVSELFKKSGKLVSHSVCRSCLKLIEEEPIPVDREEVRG